jgi:SP family sugar porter-like MFS transporter
MPAAREDRGAAIGTAGATDARGELRLGFVWMICLVAAMGGFLFGYDWVVIGGAKPFYESFFAIADAPFSQGLAMSSALFGCLAGSAVSGVLTDRYGRQPLLKFAALLFTVSGVWTGLADSMENFNFARFAGGIGIGLASNLSPLYIAEVSPAAIRGQLVSINQLTIVLGILAAQIVNWTIALGVPTGVNSAALAGTWYEQFGWRWMFAAESIPAAAFLALLFCVPESPRWLVKAGRKSQAAGVLARIGGSAYATQQCREIEQSLALESATAASRYEVFRPPVRRVLMIGVGLAVFQQWCGINVIFNYAEEVFKAAGYSVSGIMQTIVLTGVVNTLFTFVAIFTVDTIGRRALMLTGAGGLAIIYAVLGMFYATGSQGFHMVALVSAAVGCYAMSLAPVTWVIISEIFPNRVRGVGVSIAVLALWTACAALTFSFPYLNRQLGPHGTFWLYGAICVVGFWLIMTRLPETKGKSLEELERELLSGQ